MFLTENYPKNKLSYMYTTKQKCICPIAPHGVYIALFVLFHASDNQSCVHIFFSVLINHDQFCADSKITSSLAIREMEILMWCFIWKKNAKGNSRQEGPH